MKRFFTLLVSFFSLSIPIEAQKISSDYVDGKLFFQLKVTEPINFVVQKDKTVSVSEFPFLAEVRNTFGITKITRPLIINDDPQLLRSIFIYFDSIQKVDQFEEYLNSISIIENVSKEPLVKLNWDPNDPYYGNSGTLNLKWHLDLIQADSAWNIQQGLPNIRVAIVDNAVWGEHLDLQIPSNLQYNAVSDLGGNSAPPLSVNQNESCSYADIAQSNCSSYEWSHGTHCAGLVGGITNNASGIASIGGGITLIGVRCTEDGGSGLGTEAILRGVQWAVLDAGANVISMSYGSQANLGSEETLYRNLYERGVVLVAAAGNDGVEALHYPAAYSSVIAVASANSNKQLSNFSQYGNWVDIAAPGGYDVSNYTSVFSTTFSQNQILRLEGNTQFNGQYYDCMQGTSMACPVAAGLCGLMLSKNPNLTPNQIKSILQTTSMPVVGNRQINSNSGIINAYRAMQAVAATVPTASFTASDTIGASNLTVSFTSTSTGPTQPTTSNISSYKWYFQGGNPSTSTSQNPSVIYSNPGIYTVTLVVTDERGGKDSLVKENYINVSVPFSTPLVLESNKDTVLIDFYQTANGYFNITSNTSWAITNTNDWITLSQSEGDSNKTIYVTLLENTFASTRTSTLTISSENGLTTIPVVIKQNIGFPFINVNTGSITISADEGNATFDITSNTNWTITGGDSWISPSSLSGTGNQTINLDIEENTTPADRVTRFNISNSRITKRIVIQQSKKDISLTVNPESLTIEALEGNYGEFRIITDADWTITGLPLWLAVEPFAGSGDTTIRVTAISNNETGEDRDKKLAIVARDIEKEIQIIQKYVLEINDIKNKNDGLNIYPNPTNDNIYIENESNKPIKELDVIDLTGKKIPAKKIVESTKKLQIDLGSLPKGMYLLKISTSDGKSQYRKIIKN